MLVVIRMSGLQQPCGSAWLVLVGRRLCVISQGEDLRHLMSRGRRCTLCVITIWDSRVPANTINNLSLSAGPLQNGSSCQSTWPKCQALGCRSSRCAYVDCVGCAPCPGSFAKVCAHIEVLTQVIALQCTPGSKHLDGECPGCGNSCPS